MQALQQLKLAKRHATELSSEEIKPVTPAIIKLRLNENKVSQSVSRKFP